MSDPLANAQLELACRVGSAEAIDEALGEGADIDFGGSTPLFSAITAGDRDVVVALVARGADLTPFGVSSDDPVAAVRALLDLAPATPGPQEGGELDARLVRSFDRMVRNRGLAEPFAKGKGDGYSAFADGLRRIAAEERHDCVTTFLELVAPALRDGESSALDDLLNSNAKRVAELDERYRTADESPTDLIRDYLKDRKAGWTE